MHHTDSTMVTARKIHVCTYCNEEIKIGERYWRWASFDTDGGFNNKMHDECFEDVSDGSCDYFEYCPFNNERPQRDAPSEEQNHGTR